MVSVTQTLGVPFGSGFAVPGTGIVLNNILKWSDLDPQSPNVVKPGRKAGTMMSPTQVFQDGAFVLSVGTPGSYGILQTQPQMLLNALEFDMNVQEAIEAPRIRIYRDRLARRRVAHPRGRARGAGGAWSPGERARRLVVGGGRRAGHRPRSRVRCAHGRRRPAPRRVRAGDLSGATSRSEGAYARRVREATTRQSSQGSIGLRMWAWKPAGSVRSGPCSAPCAVMATTGRLPPWCGGSSRSERTNQ